MYKEIDAKGFAEKLHAIQQTDKTLSFTTCFTANDDGEVHEQSTDNWWGTKFGKAFDGTYLLVGRWGGESWYAYDATAAMYDATAIMTVEELEDIANNLFRTIETTTVCVEEV